MFLIPTQSDPTKDDLMKVCDTPHQTKSTVGSALFTQLTKTFKGRRIMNLWRIKYSSHLEQLLFFFIKKSKTQDHVFNFHKSDPTKDDK